MTWERLDPRCMIAGALVLAGLAVVAGVPTTIGIASGAGIATALLWVLPIALLLVLGGTGLEYWRWRRTRFRVGPERVEMHEGILTLRRRTLPRDRIRVVDLSADPLSRALGLTQVRIGTGEQGGEGLTLWPVRAAVGDRLRAELLVGDTGLVGDAGRDADRGLARDSAEPGAGAGRLATFRPAWLVYGPISVLTPALGAAAAGGLMQSSEWFGLQDDLFGQVGLLYGALGLVLLVVVLGAGVAVVGMVAALAVYTELWWNHRLDREPSGTLRVRRGLLTARSISIEESRLRGIELVEPLSARCAGAARVDAVVTGMKKKDGETERSESRTLLPAAPRAVARQVAATVVRGPVLDTPLTPHPVAARARRTRWAIAAVTAPVLLALLLGLLVWAPLLHASWIVAVLGVPVALLLARDAYRSLGHALTERHLVARHGAVRRSTVALDRSGIIGWTVRHTWFQRRVGLVTLYATTASGSGAYALPDIGERQALALMAETDRETVTQFLV